MSGFDIPGPAKLEPRLIGDPVTFDYDTLPEASLERARTAWEGFDLPRRRAFAAWFGLWSARERFRRR